MDCEKFLLLAEAYADGETDAETAAEMSIHIACCPKCAMEYKKFNNYRKLMRMPELPAPEGFVDRVMAKATRMQMESRMSRRMRMSALSAAAAMTLLIGLWYALNLSPLKKGLNGENDALMSNESAGLRNNGDLGEYLTEGADDDGGAGDEGVEEDAADGSDYAADLPPTVNEDSGTAELDGSGKKTDNPADEPETSGIMDTGDTDIRDVTPPDYMDGDEPKIADPGGEIAPTDPAVDGNAAGVFSYKYDAEIYADGKSGVATDGFTNVLECPVTGPETAIELAINEYTGKYEEISVYCDKEWDMWLVIFTLPDGDAYRVYIGGDGITRLTAKE